MEWLERPLPPAQGIFGVAAVPIVLRRRRHLIARSFHLFRIANSQLNLTSTTSRLTHLGGLGRVALKLILAEDAKATSRSRLRWASCPRTGVNKFVTQIYAQIGRSKLVAIKRDATSD